MKTCPYCDWENEDNATECTACGSTFEVETVVETQTGNEEYCVVFGNALNNIGIIKTIKSVLGCTISEAQSMCENGLTEGLSEVQAETLATKIRSNSVCARAVKADKADEMKADAPQGKAWAVKFVGYKEEGEEDNALINEENTSTAEQDQDQTGARGSLIAFLMKYYEMSEEMATEYLDCALEEKEGVILETDCSKEAEEIVDTLENIGVCAEIMLREWEWADGAQYIQPKVETSNKVRIGVALTSCILSLTIIVILIVVLSLNM